MCPLNSPIEYFFVNLLKKVVRESKPIFEKYKKESTLKVYTYKKKKDVALFFGLDAIFKIFLCCSC
jgi:hypothetical protein